MVHTVKAVPEVRVILLGEYVYGDEKAYRRAVAEAGLDAHFDFCGVVPFEEVPAYIAVAQVGLILLQPGIENHRLAMPHKLFDYMREGKPVIAPAFSVEVARIVREADCGLLVDVTNPKAIAEAAVTLLTDPAYAKRLGQNGRRAVEETYNWEKEESVLLEALQRLTPG
jgi:glycosyltransferase involved in cell wall biosynthesis